MEKETVLEIAFMPIWDKWAWKIIKQNEDILKRGTFEDKGIGVSSISYPNYSYPECILNIRGYDKEKDNLINLCTEDEKREIEVKVRNINEKYGFSKRWRAEHGGVYYCINEPFGITWYIDGYTDASNKKYENGNYFKTEAEALGYAEYMKKKSLEWHEKRDNNE
jgi:hypothetical protein F3_00887